MITITHEAFKLAQVFTISRGSRTEVKVTTVSITRDGVTGWGECTPYPRYDESAESVEALIRSVPENITRTELQDALPAGAARNALDCALWDLEAKQTGKRVWELAGLPVPKPVPTVYTISLAEPDEMMRNAAENNFRPCLKVKLGTPDDLPRLEAVRKGAPDPAIVLDANEGWSAGIYADLAPHLTRLGVSMVEQPLPAGADDALLGMDRPVPICADESAHDRSTLAQLKGKYDIVNIKLDKTGGLTEGLALREAAQAMGFQTMMGCMMSTSLAMAPGVICAQGCVVVDLDPPLLLAEDRDVPLFYDEAGAHPAPPDLWG